MEKITMTFEFTTVEEAKAVLAFIQRQKTKKTRTYPDLIDGKYIAELRTEAGLTQVELAKLSDIHNVTIANIERGNRQTTRKTLDKLETAISRTQHNSKK